MEASPPARELDLVVVGHRPGVLEAAAGLRLATYLVADAIPPAARRRLAGWRELPWSELPRAAAEIVAGDLGDQRPPVVAAGEKAVLLAAALRGRLGVDGVSTETAERARDKHAMKTAIRAAGIPCADWMPLDGGEAADELIARLGLPLVAKERRGAGSYRLAVARSPDDVAGALARVASEPGTWMAERFIDGVEMSVESFVAGGKILLANPTEYLVPAFANIAPAALAPETWAAVKDLNRRALEVIGFGRGMSHLELFLTENGPVFGEVALRPPGGRIMRLLRRAYGFDPWEAVVRLERGEVPELPTTALLTAGVWMLHPGPGTVTSVEGLEAARRIIGVRKLVCRVGPGSKVKARESTGADVGWIEVRGLDRPQVAERLREARDAIRFVMAP